MKVLFLISFCSLISFLSNASEPTKAHHLCERAKELSGKQCGYKTYNGPGGFGQLVKSFFQSNDEIDSFDLESNACNEIETGGIKKLIVRYDSKNDVCYYGYTYRDGIHHLKVYNQNSKLPDHYENIHISELKFAVKEKNLKRIQNIKKDYNQKGSYPSAPLNSSSKSKGEQ